jgi:hypothetical protein
MGGKNKIIKDNHLFTICIIVEKQGVRIIAPSCNALGRATPVWLNVKPLRQMKMRLCEIPLSSG